MSENQSGFVALPHFILQNPDLTPESIILYANLLHFDRKGGRGCFAKRSTISKFSNLSLHKVRNAIQVLEDNGIISVCRRRNHLTDVIKITPDCRPPIKEAARRPARSSARSSNVSDLQTSLTAHSSPARVRPASSSNVSDLQTSLTAHSSPARVRPASSSNVSDLQTSLTAHSPAPAISRTSTSTVSNSLISISSKDITQEEPNKICPNTAPEGVGHHKNKVPMEQDTAPSPKPNQHYQQATAELLDHLKSKISPKSIDAWFGNSWIEKQTDTEVIFRTGKGPYVADWLSHNYIAHIQAFTGKAVQVIS